MSEQSHTYTGAGLFYGSHRLVDAVHKLADMLKVSGHLCGQHHVDNRLPQCSELIPVKVKVLKFRSGLLATLMQQESRLYPAHPHHRPVCVLEDVAFAVPHSQLEGEGRVVALQHRRVVVEDRQLTSCVAQEGVGPAWVVHVVHRGCYQGSHFIQLVQTALNDTAETQSDVRSGLHSRALTYFAAVFSFINNLPVF